MNLQALYDLKERLEYSAIAGTGLLQEDFRLKRAAEALAPLAAASPVFAKISSAVGKLLEAPAEERSKLLLDVLSLVDAVVYTQGTVGMSGEMTTINHNENSEGKYIHVSYSQLQPLITSLTTTGSGRMAVIEECKNTHPEFFEDFRVLPYVVAALGDSYAEIPDLICEILRKQGKEIIPLLKEGFDPAGKKDMVRRAMLIWEIAGSDENEWYISVLPEAKKDIREIIIKALGESKENEKLLLDLCNSEKGKTKEAALYALAKMDTEECAIYWEKEINKNIKRAECLVGVDSQIAADMSAYAMQKYLEKIFQENGVNCNMSQQMELSELSEVLVGKYSEKIYDFWIWVAEKLSNLSENAVGATTSNIKGTMPTYMVRTILCKPCENVFELARVLADKYPKYFMNCAFLVDLMQMESKSVYEKYSHYLLNTSEESKEIQNEKTHRLQLMQIFHLVYWNDSDNTYELRFSMPCNDEDRIIHSSISLLGFDKGWMKLFVDNKLNRQGTIYDINNLYKLTSFMDDIVQHTLNKEDEEVCKIAGKYLYERVIYSGNLHPYFAGLLKCGWSEWKGLITHCAKKTQRLDIYYTNRIINQMNMSKSDKIAELRELESIISDEKNKIKSSKWERDNLKQMIAEIEENN